MLTVTIYVNYNRIVFSVIINTDADRNLTSAILSNSTGSDNNISFHFTSSNVTINIHKIIIFIK